MLICPRPHGWCTAEAQIQRAVPGAKSLRSPPEARATEMKMPEDRLKARPSLKGTYFWGSAPGMMQQAGG